VLLEPLVHLEVTVPDVSMGDITGDLASRRARISESRADGNGNITVVAQVPLAELQDYAARVKSISGGHGSYTMTFSHYEPAPPAVQKELMSQYGSSH
jgi:elongation factor G